MRYGFRAEPPEFARSHRELTDFRRGRCPLDQGDPRRQRGWQGAFCHNPPRTRPALASGGQASLHLRVQTGEVLLPGRQLRGLEAEATWQPIQRRRPGGTKCSGADPVHRAQNLDRTKGEGVSHMVARWAVGGQPPVRDTRFYWGALS